MYGQNGEYPQGFLVALSLVFKNVYGHCCHCCSWCCHIWLWCTTTIIALEGCNGDIWKKLDVVSLMMIATT